MTANIFNYSNNIGQNIIIFNNNLKNHIAEEDFLNQYREKFRCIEFNYEIIKEMDYDNKSNLELLIKELCEPLDKYYHKYLKVYENDKIAECDVMAHKYHLNKYNNQISTINFILDDFIKDYKNYLDLDKCLSFRYLD